MSVYFIDRFFEIAVKLSQSKMIDKIVTVKKEGGLVSYSWENLAGTVGGKYDEKAISFDLIKDSFRKLIGRTLTIIDASTTGAQNKAMKDLVRGAFNEEIGFVSDLVFDQKKIQEDVDEMAKDMTNEELVKHSVSVEEMLGA